MPAGYCFGVELVVDNVITYYLYDQFRLNAVVAGAMGSIFGTVSVCESLPMGFECCPYNMLGMVVWGLKLLGSVSWQAVF